MLSRVAENLFWIGRYMERAENIARLVDVARRMSAVPGPQGGAPSNEWSSILIAAGAREAFGERLDGVGREEAIEHLLFSRENPSSVRACLMTARENARAIRFALTQECWEALNAAWSQMRVLNPAAAQGSGLADVVDWVKSQSALFRGAVNGNMVRDDGYDFIKLGAAVERIDSTARLLDVKYHVLLPSVSDVGTSADHYQWLSLLQAAGAQRAYFFLTKSDVSARGVAEFLILEPYFPGAIRFNSRRVAEAHTSLEAFYGQPAGCHELVIDFVKDIEGRSIEDIFRFGLHEFLTTVIERNYHVANELAAAFGFAPMLTETGGEEANGQ